MNSSARIVTQGATTVPRVALRALAATAAAAGLFACAAPIGVRTSSSAAGPAPDEGAVSAERVAQPVVQVRQFRSSAIVYVVGWDADEAFYGLRAQLRRGDGILAGQSRHGDHSLYISSTLNRYMGGFQWAQVPDGPLLLRAGSLRDDYACFFGDKCSPAVSVTLGVPDEILRANRDSLVVMLHAGLPTENWSIKLRGDVIEAYLRTVDSVAVALQRR